MWFATQFWTRGRLNITPIGKYLVNIDIKSAKPFYVISSMDLPSKPLAYSTPDYRLYLLDPKLLPEVYWSTGRGFYGSENWSGTPTRWMQADATILVSSTDNRTANLRLNAVSFYRNRTLGVSSGGALAAQVAVPTRFINLSAPIHLAKGANAVQFHVREGCDRPSDIKELNNSDDRCLSVAVQNLGVT